MKGNSGSKTVMLSTIFALIFLISSSTIHISAVDDTSPPSRVPIRVDISAIVPYHSATNGDQDLTGEACLQMAFDAHLNGYDGPSVDQQDIRNVTKGRLGAGVADLDELRLAAHYSQEAIVGERGYEERYYGYGSAKYDWTNWPLEMSPRFGERFLLWSHDILCFVCISVMRVTVQSACLAMLCCFVWCLTVIDAPVCLACVAASHVHERELLLLRR